MEKTFTCIMCPRGCAIKAGWEKKESVKVQGNHCKKGEEYVVQEIKAPKRNIASSVLISNGDELLASVKLSNPVPKEEIFHVVEEIKKVKVNAPVKIGDVVIKNVLGLESDVIITRNVDVR